MKAHLVPIQEEEMAKVSKNMNMKWILLAVQHHIGPAVHTSSLRFNISKLNMLLANQSDLMAHLFPHTRGRGCHGYRFGLKC